MAGLLPPGFSFDDEQPAAPTSVLPPGFRFDDEPVPQPDTAPLPPARPADLGAEAANPQPADVPLPPARPTDLGPPNDYGPSDWPTTAAPTGTGGVLDSVLGNAGKLTPEQGAAEQEANAAAAQQALRASRE